MHRALRCVQRHIRSLATANGTSGNGSSAATVSLSDMGTQGVGREAPRSIQGEIRRIASTEDFASTIARGPSLVAFTAAWSGPCRMLAPVLRSAVDSHNAGSADRHEPRVELVAVDIDAVPSLAVEHGVTTVPHVALFRCGNVASSFTGMQPLDFVASFLRTTQ